MGLVLKWLSGSFGTYILIAAAVAFTALAGTTYWLWGARTELLKENGQLSAQLETAVLANASQKEAIDGLVDANKQWADLAAKNQEAMREASHNLALFVSENRRLEAALRVAEEKDRANPECLQLLSASVTAVCPNISDGMWTRSHRGESPNGGEARTGNGLH